MKWIQLIFLIISLKLLKCEIPSDYELYDLIDTVEEMTEFTTFYDLLGVSATATTAQIASSYRKMSLDWHPDKKRDDPLAGEKFAMLSSVATILKNAESRERYDWLINEAPAWHRSTYLMKKFVTAKLSIVQVIFITLVFATVVQFISLYAKYASDLYHYKANERAVNELGVKEMKRLRRKLDTATPIMILTNPDLLAMKKTEEKVELPGFRDLLFWKIIVGFKDLFCWCFKLVTTKKEKKIEEIPEEIESEESEKDEDEVQIERKPKVRRKKQWEMAQESNSTNNLSNASSNNSSSTSVQNPFDTNQEEEELKIGPFSEAETQHLIQLLNAFPQGTTGRYVTIARKLKRNVQDVIDRIQDLKSKLK